jgi:hypothetical protein
MRRSDIVFGIIYLIKHPPKVRFNATTVSSWSVDKINNSWRSTQNR